jgi:uncharacterized protein YdeI (YjbR/CyaY-like superfamily)
LKAAVQNLQVLTNPEGFPHHSGMAKLEDLPEVHPLTRAEWRRWLVANHATSGSIWLVTYKKASGKPRFDTGEAVDEALCFGWIDSLPRKLDDERSKLLMSPRKKGSAWSAVNKAKVEQLIAEGRMAAPGLAAITRSKADGTWNKLDGVDRLDKPDELIDAFARQPGSEMLFDAFPISAKRGILEWILNARTPETLAKRVEETARLAARNIRANQWPRK